MGRSDYPTTTLKFSGGVNQEDEDASLEECADCLNVWRRRGRTETRPGYVGVGWHAAAAFDAGTLDFRSEINSLFAAPVAGILDISSMVKDRDRWYAGFTATFHAFQVRVFAANGSKTIAQPEYWDGTRWGYLHVTQTNTVGGGYHLSQTGGTLYTFAKPDDWALVTVDSLSRYWIRFNIQGASLDAVTSLDTDDVLTGIFTTDTDVRGIHVAQFPSTKRYFLVTRYDSGGGKAVGVFSGSNLHYGDDTSIAETGASARVAPSTLAVVPQFGEAYLAYDNQVTRLVSFPNDTVGGDEAATVEDRDFALGEAAPYDKRFVAMLGTWPRASLMASCNGRLWAAGIAGEPFTIRWTAAVPYHRVWTSLAFEYLMENDNSPVTAIHPLGEQLVVFKNDSIWLMVSVGENQATGVEHFIPRRIVSGTGCVAHQSVKAINGELVFLAEGGIYAFNGTPNVRKVTTRATETGKCDRLAATMATVAGPYRQFAAAANWKSQNCYMLSFSTGGRANDTTVVWDYEDNTWWIWDSIDAQHWLVDEGLNDSERLFFGDSNGRIHQFGIGRTDNGAAISSHVTSHRVGARDVTTRAVRSVVATATNDTRSLSVSVIPNDGTAVSSTMDMTDATEKDWAAFNWGGAADDDSWTPQRRRQRRSDFKAQADWYQVKVSHSTKNQRMRLSSVAVGAVPLGRR